VAERWREEINLAPVPVERGEVPVSASFGVAVFLAPGVVDGATLVRAADAAL
jgi:GGDEF domain-containing protein